MNSTECDVREYTSAYRICSLYSNAKINIVASLDYTVREVTLRYVNRIVGHVTDVIVKNKHFVDIVYVYSFCK